MKRVYLTIEQAVERCYPKATKEEKAKLAEQYRKVMKDGQKIMDWEPESEEERIRNEQYMQFHINHLITQWQMNPGHWQRARQALTKSTTVTSQQD